MTTIRHFDTAPRYLNLARVERWERFGVATVFRDRVVELEEFNRYGHAGTVHCGVVRAVASSAAGGQDWLSMETTEHKHLAFSLATVKRIRTVEGR